MGLVLAVAGSAEGMDLWTILLNAHPVSKVVFVLLIICSVLCVAVILERWLVLKRVQRDTGEVTRMLQEWMGSRQRGVVPAEIAGATRETSPLLSVLRAGMAGWREMEAIGETRLELMESMVSQAMVREVKLVRAMLRANLPILANIASTAPFIGLFGTVVGIILTFDAISRTGNMGQELVASGIADALVATAMGLFAAIPAVIAYNVFSDRIATIVLGIEETAMEHIYYLVQGEPQRETV